MNAHCWDISARNVSKWWTDQLTTVTIPKAKKKKKKMRSHDIAAWSHTTMWALYWGIWTTSCNSVTELKPEATHRSVYKTILSLMWMPSQHLFIVGFFFFFFPASATPTDTEHDSNPDQIIQFQGRWINKSLFLFIVWIPSHVVG